MLWERTFTHLLPPYESSFYVKNQHKRTTLSYSTRCLWVWTENGFAMGFIRISEKEGSKIYWVGSWLQFNWDTGIWFYVYCIYRALVIYGFAVFTILYIYALIIHFCGFYLRIVQFCILYLYRCNYMLANLTVEVLKIIFWYCG